MGISGIHCCRQLVGTAILAKGKMLHPNMKALRCGYAAKGFLPLWKES